MPLVEWLGALSTVLARITEGNLRVELLFVATNKLVLVLGKQVHQHLRVLAVKASRGVSWGVALG